MSLLSPAERDQLQQQLGERDELVRQFEREIARQRRQWESDAQEWQRLQQHRHDLADWLVVSATDEHGRLVQPRIDAALGGETFVPGTMIVTIREKRYQIALVSTCYDVEEI